MSGFAIRVEIADPSACLAEESLPVMVLYNEMTGAATSPIGPITIAAIPAVAIAKKALPLLVFCTKLPAIPPPMAPPPIVVAATIPSGINPSPKVLAAIPVIIPPATIPPIIPTTRPILDLCLCFNSLAIADAPLDSACVVLLAVDAAI